MPPRRARVSQKGSTPTRASKHRRAADSAPPLDESDGEVDDASALSGDEEEEEAEEEADDEDDDASALSGDDHAGSESKDVKDHRRKGLPCVPIGASFTIEVEGGSIVVTRLSTDSAKCNEPGCTQKFEKHGYHISQIRQHGKACLRKAAAKLDAAAAKEERAAAKRAAKANASDPEVKFAPYLAEPPAPVTETVEGEAVTCTFQNILIGTSNRLHCSVSTQ